METVNALAEECHTASRTGGWYNDPNTGAEIDRNIPEMLAMVHSEVSEALEGHRKGSQDKHLPHRLMIEVELADAIHRICDLAGYLGLDLGGALVEKMEYNKNRPDHKVEARRSVNGKKY